METQQTVAPERCTFSNFLFHVFDLIVGVLMIVDSCVVLSNPSSFQRLFLPLYFILFGVVIVLFVFFVPRHTAIGSVVFYFYFIGRGFTFLLIGILVYNWGSPLDQGVGIFTVIIAFVYILMSMITKFARVPCSLPPPMIQRDKGLPAYKEEDLRISFRKNDANDNNNNSDGDPMVSSSSNNNHDSNNANQTQATIIELEEPYDSQQSNDDATKNETQRPTKDGSSSGSPRSTNSHSNNRSTNNNTNSSPPPTQTPTKKKGLPVHKSVYGGQSNEKLQTARTIAPKVEKALPVKPSPTKTIPPQSPPQQQRAPSNAAEAGGFGDSSNNPFASVSESNNNNHKDNTNSNSVSAVAAVRPSVSNNNYGNNGNNNSNGGRPQMSARDTNLARSRINELIASSFGKELKKIEYMSVDGYDNEVPAVLVLLEQRLSELNGYSKSGIFHIQTIEKNVNANDECYNMANNILVFLAQLPAPLWSGCASALNKGTSKEAMWRVIEMLPEPPCSTTLFLWNMCAKVARNEQQTQMGSDELGQVFGNICTINSDTELLSDAMQVSKNVTCFRRGIAWRMEK